MCKCDDDDDDDATRFGKSSLLYSVERDFGGI